MVTLESKTLQVKSAVAVAQTRCSCLNDYKKENVKNSTLHPNSSVLAKGAALGLCPRLDERMQKTKFLPGFEQAGYKSIW